MAEPVQPEAAAPEPARRRSDGEGVQLRRGVQDRRSRCPEEGHRGGDDDLTGLVARRLRPLRSALHPHGVACGGHLSHLRRPRRRRRRRAALRAAQQLARQRQPGQGTPAAVADQAEVRPQGVVGRPAGPHRQRRARVDGLQDVRLRRRPRGHLGAHRSELGHRGHVARRRALQGRTTARQPARRGADGPDLRQPGRPQRQPGSPRRGARHPRDVPPHGDERRGDRRADRRRAHVRQDARRRPGDARRPGARRRADSRPRASAGSAATARAAAATRSPAVSRSPGRRRRPRGATASSRTSSASSGS